MPDVFGLAAPRGDEEVVVVAEGPPVGGRSRDVGLAGLAVGGLAALVEGAAGAHEDRQLVVEVVAVPGGDAGAGLEAEHFPGVPQAGEAADRLAVLPPPVAPAGLAAEGAAGHPQEGARQPVFG